MGYGVSAYQRSTPLPPAMCWFPNLRWQSPQRKRVYKMMNNNSTPISNQDTYQVRRTAYFVCFTTTQGFVTNLCSIWFSKICGWTGYPSMHWIQVYCRKTAGFSCKLPKERGEKKSWGMFQSFVTRWQCCFKFKQATFWIAIRAGSKFPFTLIYYISTLFVAFVRQAK